MAQDLSEFMAKMKKDLKGGATISLMREVKTPFGIRLPTGIMSLDLALKGGYPAGSLHQVFGPDGAGKDYLTNRLMAETQATYGDDTNIFWVSFGYRPDLDFMRMAGVQLAYTNDELRTRGIDPKKATVKQRGKDVGNVLFIDINLNKVGDKPAETLLQGVITCIKSNHFQMGVINELGSGETRHDVEKQLGEDAKIANWAKLMADFLRKYYTAMRTPRENGDPNATTVFVINPVRANLDARSARFQKYTQPSGTALRHAKAVDTHLEPGAAIRKESEKIGKEVRWKLSKGKHGISEGANGKFEFFFDKGVDLVREIAQAAKAAEIIYTRGPIYYIQGWNDDTPEAKIKGGIAGVVELLKAEPKLLKSIRDRLLEQAKGW